ncbi:cytochrome c biogenesis protein CcdA [Herbihabitans rhizosphaerae]|uniref:Cytochrome c biogenesis protein CcdA n=1 Tax=Herbihabitans rhizosphaerae TaxID=1872711 RepID=A0A4Q7KD15_9PSEU|nr:cytochrome c biogenesis protein CcdA [Herbihabitans rhizosphaerae]RZS31429.1 cytochrome c biogenesis protein CcdA [Herbihabitans rhizosphaerae]
MWDTLLVALTAGMLATVNPCGFAMLPAYLTMVVTGAGDLPAARRVWRALAASALMTAGFVVVFGVFGALFEAGTATVQEYLPIVTIVIGAIMLVVGVIMLAGKEITLLLPKLTRGAPGRGLPSMFGYGVAFAIASLSCTIAPFLAVASSVFRGADMLEGLLAFVVYAAGMGLVVAVLAVSAALASDAIVAGARRVLPYVARIGGALLIIAGAYVGYYGVYELRGTASEDPVIDAAARVQSAIADFVAWVGPVPLVIVLVALIAGGVLLRRRGRRGTMGRTR